VAEIYVSTDIEADGPIPGPYSMLSFASAAVRADGTPADTFAANLAALPGASADPATMAWWDAHPEAWAAFYWYLIRFTGASPFSHSALDLKTYAMALLGTGYRDSTKRRLPREWFGPARHTHVALDDAIEQAELFVNMLAASRPR
jgi:hypothetical protein